MAFLQFHSKSALLTPKNNPFGFPPDAARILSNFGPISIEWRGHIYPTVEHAFQGAKYLEASNHPELEAKFRVGGAIGPEPIAAKKAGGKAGMKAMKAVLDVKKWNAISNDIMGELIANKVMNAQVHAILKICHDNNIKLYHFSRSDMKWGCHMNPDGTIKKGENLLGKIYMQISDHMS